MKVMLDENLPHRLRHEFSEHEVSTVAYMSWSGIKNGELLKLAEAGGFQVLVTADRNMQYQQNLEGRRLSLVCLTAQRWETLSHHSQAILAAIDASFPGSYQVVDCNSNPL
jgi:predicted nuclease of predicted toxin-antitoxin system